MATVHILSKMCQRVLLAAQLQGGIWSGGVRVVIEAADLIYERHGHGKGLAADSHQHGAGDLEADRELHRERSALPFKRLHINCATQSRNGIANHVEADAATAFFG